MEEQDGTASKAPLNGPMPFSFFSKHFGAKNATLLLLVLDVPLSNQNAFQNFEDGWIHLPDAPVEMVRASSHGLCDDFNVRRMTLDGGGHGGST